MRRSKLHPLWPILLNPPRLIITTKALSPLRAPYDGSWWGGSAGESAGLSGPIADITALIAQLGGNALVPAFYDGRLNVTAAGGLVNTWQDARGPGFGPNLTAAGTARPTYQATDHVAFDGVNNIMGTAAVAAFDLSHPISLVFVASAAAATSGQSMAAIADTANTGHGILDAQFQAGPNWGSFCGGQTTDTAVLSSNGIIRVVVFTYNGTAHTAQVPNHVLSSSTVNAAIAQNLPLTLGAFGAGQAVSPSVIYNAIVYAGVLSAPLVTDILTWAVNFRAAVAAS